MNTRFFTTVWIAAKIWFVAVLTNTVLGAIYLTDFFSYLSDAGYLIGEGLLFGTAFSFPVFIGQLIVIRSCIARQVSGEWLFRIVFICGIVLTVAVFMIFNKMLGGLGSMMYGLLFISLLSAIIGTGTQNRSLYNLGNNYQPSK